MANVKVLGATREAIVMSAGALDAEFESWWLRYPRKIGRLAARKAYEKARAQATAGELMAGVERYINHKPSYADWCHAQTFLHQGRWMDSYDTARPVANTDDYLASMGHWTAGCKRLHGGACQSANEHYERVEGRGLIPARREE